MPIDPVSDGTWIGVNEAGLAATLLNVNPSRTAHASDGPDARGHRSHDRAGRSDRADSHVSQAGLLSRGLIVPIFLFCPDVRCAVVKAQRLDPKAYPPFRAVVVDDHRLAEVVSDGVEIRVRTNPRNEAPQFFTSSGLGDEIVQAPRRELFEAAFAAGDLLAAQAAFHRHSWPDRTHLSVCMRRPDACTVSYTVVDVASDRVTLSYHGGPPDEPGRPVALTLPRKTRRP